VRIESAALSLRHLHKPEGMPDEIANRALPHSCDENTAGLTVLAYNDAAARPISVSDTLSI